MSYELLTTPRTRFTDIIAKYIHTFLQHGNYLFAKSKSHVEREQERKNIEGWGITKWMYWTLVMKEDTKPNAFFLFCHRLVLFFGSGYVHKSVSDKENMKSNMNHSNFWMAVLTAWMFPEL